MNVAEARRVLEAELEMLRGEAYADLVQRLGAGTPCERIGESGATYQIDVQVLWDAAAGGNVRVIGAIDDGGWRALAPVTASFIKAPDGSFVGE